MSNSNDAPDQDLEQELDKGLKFSDGILNMVDEMARHTIIKNKNVDELNLLFTLQDFYKNNEEAKNGNKRHNFNSLTKKEPEFINECSKKELPRPKKKKRNKFGSFTKAEAYPIKKVNSVNKNGFANQFNKDSNNKNNNPGQNKNNNMQKKYININKNRISVLVDTDNFIKHQNTNPKKNGLFKFINKDKDNNKSNNKKNQIENLVTNRPKNNSIKKKVTFSNKKLNYKDKENEINKISIDNKNSPKNEDNNNKSLSIQLSPKNEKTNNIFSIQNSPKNETINEEIKSSIQSKNSYKNESNNKIPVQIRNSPINNRNRISTENKISLKMDSPHTLSPQNNVSSNNEIVDKTTSKNKNSFNNEKLNNIKSRVSNQNINEIKKNKDFSFKPSRNSSIKDRNINNINVYIRKNTNNEININTNNIDKYDSYSSELDNIDIEIIKPEESNYNINITKNYSKFKGKKGLDRLYYVEMNNLEKKRRKLSKERQLIIEKKMSEVKEKPELNANTIDIMTKNNNIYKPIQERAAKIHSRKLTQIYLNDFQKQLEKENEEKKDLEEIRLHKSKKKYNPYEWNEFVQSQNDWIKGVKYKRKAAQILQSRKYNYKPKMNPKSRNIINKLTKKNASMDDVFNRLYNDVEDREERQKALDKNYIPPFNPRQGNKKYIKFINKRKNRKFPELFITSYDKNNYFLNSQISLNGGYIYPMSSRNHIIKRNDRCKYCYLKNEKNKNSSKSSTFDNSTIFANKSTNENTFGFFSKVATIEPNLVTESCISSNPRNYYNNYRINQSYDNIMAYNDNYDKNHNSKRLNKSKPIRINSNIYKEKLKYYNNRNNCYNYPLNYNETINITSGKYKNFFNIENIEEL